MASVLDLVKHYQHSIEKYPNDEHKILKCIDKLYNLAVTVQHLQETGVGRTVNALRKEPGDVGQAARALVYKWKVMVAAEESDQEDTNNDTTNYNGNENGKNYEHNVNETRSKSEKYEKSHQVPKTEERHKHTNGDYGSKRKYQSSEEETEPETKKSKYSNTKDNGYKIKLEKQIKTESSGSEVDSQDDSSQSDSESEDSQSSEEERKPDIKIKKETIKTEKYQSPPSKHSSSSRDKQRHDSYSENNKQRYDSSNEIIKDNSDKHSKHKSSETKHSTERYTSKDTSHSSQSHKSSKDNDYSNEKKEHRSSESDRRHKHESSSKPSEKHRTDISEKVKSSSSSSSDKHRSHGSTEKQKSCSEKHKSSSSSEKHRSSSSSDKQKVSENPKPSSEKQKSHTEKSSEKQNSSKSDRDKHKQFSEKDVLSDKHKSKESSSSKDKHKDKIKEKNSSSKEKEHSHKSEKKHSTTKDVEAKHSDKRKSSSHEDKSSKKEKSKSKSSKTNSKSKDEEPKKQKRQENDDGIDCGSGASFAEALGMISPAKPKKKPTFVKDVSSPNSNDDLCPATLLAPNAKLAPLPALEISALPEISPNYRPRPPPKFLPHFNEDDAISAGISSKNQRTKVYSGNKTIGKITTLYEMCVHVLQEHIDALEYTGGVPYEILKPVVDRATPQQLFVLEHFNPYLMEDTDHLWQKYCEKNFRNKKRQEMETWREMYMRCQEEQEIKLKSLTANIKIAQEAKKAPIKQTKMAYVDSVVKPPRNIAKKQAQHGTAFAATASPAARVASLSAAPNVLKGGRPTPVPTVSSSSFKPKKAPLMQKALQFLRGRKR